MSGLDNLRKRWSGLVFRRVSSIHAKDPGDVSSIRIVRDDGHTDRYITSCAIADIPEVDRSRADVAWRRYHGMAGDVFFHRDDFLELDLDIDMTMTWGQYGNHQGGYRLPQVGDLLCGEIKRTNRGRRFDRWFICEPGFRNLHRLIAGSWKGEATPESTAPAMMASHYPDLYWAIALLAYFNDVSWFLERRPHPATGVATTKCFPSGKWLTVSHSGLWLPTSTDCYVHTLSRSLGEPAWWSDFRSKWSGEHPDHMRHCRACEAEDREAREADYPWG